MAYAVRTVTGNAVNADSGMAYGKLVAATTPALEYIELGWMPSKIELVNYTATNPLVYYWQSGQASTNGFLNTGSTGVITKGITGPYPYAGTASVGSTVTVDGVAGCSVAPGFTIPAALQNNASDTWVWTAWR
jgi:hypothetical protein